MTATHIPNATDTQSSVTQGSVWWVPRAPLHRNCVIDAKGKGYPDDGEGVWCIQGYAAKDTPEEVYYLQRVAPAKEGGSIGECITVSRQLHEYGRLQLLSAASKDPVVRKEELAAQASPNTLYSLAEEDILNAAKKRFGLNVTVSAPYWIDLEAGTVRVGIYLAAQETSFGADFYFKEGKFH